MSKTSPVEEATDPVEVARREAADRIREFAHHLRTGVDMVVMALKEPPKVETHTFHLWAVPGIPHFVREFATEKEPVAPWTDPTGQQHHVIEIEVEAATLAPKPHPFEPGVFRLKNGVCFEATGVLYDAARASNVRPELVMRQLPMNVVARRIARKFLPSAVAQEAIAALVNRPHSSE